MCVSGAWFCKHIVFGLCSCTPPQEIIALSTDPHPHPLCNAPHAPHPQNPCTPTPKNRPQASERPNARPAICKTLTLTPPSAVCPPAPTLGPHLCPLQHLPNRHPHVSVSPKARSSRAVFICAP